jgi:hypothetical protein
LGLGRTDGRVHTPKCEIKRARVDQEEGTGVEKGERPGAQQKPAFKPRPFEEDPRDRSLP